MQKADSKRRPNTIRLGVAIALHIGAENISNQVELICIRPSIGRQSRRDFCIIPNTNTNTDEHRRNRRKSRVQQSERARAHKCSRSCSSSWFGLLALSLLVWQARKVSARDSCGSREPICWLACDLLCQSSICILAANYYCCLYCDYYGLLAERMVGVGCAALAFSWLAG